MKISILALVLFFFTFEIYAQTDSTTIKLQQYKKMFNDSLISFEEYEVLKKNLLGIQPKQPPVVYIQKEERRMSKEQIARLKDVGSAKLAAAVGLIILGGAVTTGYVLASNKGVLNKTTRLVLPLIAGLSFTGTIPLFIVGGIQVGKANRERQRLLSSP